jgi:hypothetical protein
MHMHCCQRSLQITQMAWHTHENMQLLPPAQPGTLATVQTAKCVPRTSKTALVTICVACMECSTRGIKNQHVTVSKILNAKPGMLGQPAAHG